MPDTFRATDHDLPLAAAGTSANTKVLADLSWYEII